MAIKANFTQADIRRRLDVFLDEIERQQIEILQELGERCLTEARENRGYMDQSGALNSSTGYQVFVDGVAVHTKFEKASGGSDESAKAKGVKAGQELSEQVGRETKGVALVVVAGMNYAAYVETKKNVLASAERLAKRELPKMLEQLVGNIKSAAE